MGTPAIDPALFLRGKTTRRRAPDRYDELVAAHQAARRNVPRLRLKDLQYNPIQGNIFEWILYSVRKVRESNAEYESAQVQSPRR